MSIADEILIIIAFFESRIPVPERRTYPSRTHVHACPMPSHCRHEERERGPDFTHVRQVKRKTVETLGGPGLGVVRAWTPHPCFLSPTGHMFVLVSASSTPSRCDQEARVARISSCRMCQFSLTSLSKEEDREGQAVGGGGSDRWIRSVVVSFDVLVQR